MKGALLLLFCLLLIITVQAATDPTPTTTPTAPSAPSDVPSDAELEKMYHDVLIAFNEDETRERESRKNPFPEELRKGASLFGDMDFDSVLEEAQSWIQKNLPSFDPTEDEEKPEPTPVPPKTDEQKEDEVLEDAQNYLDKEESKEATAVAEPSFIPTQTAPPEPEPTPTPAPTQTPAPPAAPEFNKQEAIAKVLGQKNDFVQTLLNAHNAINAGSALSHLPSAFFPKQDTTLEDKKPINVKLEASVKLENEIKNQALKQQTDLTAVVAKLQTIVHELRGTEEKDRRRKAIIRAHRLRQRMHRIRNQLLDQQEQLRRMRRIIRLQRQLSAESRRVTSFDRFSAARSRFDDEYMDDEFYPDY